MRESMSLRQLIEDQWLLQKARASAWKPARSAALWIGASVGDESSRFSRSEVVQPKIQLADNVMLTLWAGVEENASSADDL
jgi:hypothetical protein